MPFDYKKEFKELYLPKKKPELIEVPSMNYVAIRGKGNPNTEDGAYKQSIQKLYAISYTIKMSKMGEHRIEGYFDYVVPPLEGFWWMEVKGKPDFTKKDAFNWISCIRLPEFVTPIVFQWAVAEAEAKKGMNLSDAEYLVANEGQCAQIMHVGSYDSEPETIDTLDAFVIEAGFVPDFTQSRRHHEIYLSDPRRVKPENCKTVIRIPIKRA
ncbi:GyrI-like domain-containing protein [Adlercreutzia sp. ZJ138]|uniref:GyrI-like domain-containing protein n=1 Tax=Adlercreutzia sp. ZJ138 TaxID=2709405 RepID=UPI0013EB3B52|nr:GyrI-like domain-containing protein [Adlercreutzia sp. ZJ138]